MTLAKKTEKNRDYYIIDHKQGGSVLHFIWLHFSLKSPPLLYFEPLGKLLNSLSTVWYFSFVNSDGIFV